MKKSLWQSKLPKYAQKADPDQVFEIQCDHCGRGRWAVLKSGKSYPGKKALREGKGGAEAVCLFCDGVSVRYYNWGGQPHETDF